VDSYDYHASGLSFRPWVSHTPRGVHKLQYKDLGVGRSYFMILSLASLIATEWGVSFSRLGTDRRGQTYSTSAGTALVKFVLRRW